MNTIKTKILDAVQRNTVTMRPKWKFVVYSSLAIAGILVSFLLVIFVLSLILFVLSRYGFMYMPFFGFGHIMRTLSVVSPLLLVCALLLIVLIEILSRRYAFSFRRPLLVTVLSITSVSIVVSFIISETPMHEYVKLYAKDHRISMMEQAYNRPVPFRHINGMDVIRGEVVSSTPTSTILELFNDDQVTVYVSSTTLDFKPLTIGDDVVILGTFEGDHFVFVEARLAKGMHFGGRMNGRRMMQERSMQFSPMMK